MALRMRFNFGCFCTMDIRWGWNYPLEKLDSPVLDLMNVRYIIAGRADAARVAAVRKFRHVASLPGNELFENTSVLPRYFLVHQLAPLHLLNKRET